MHLRKYIEKYGKRSFRDFYEPLCAFFGTGYLANVTIIDETRQRRSPKFRFQITEEHRAAFSRWMEGKRVKFVITDESIGQ